MKKNQDRPPDAAELRRRAQERLSEKPKSQRSEVGNQRTAEDAARLVHELQVHQIELEMQNEELQRARDKLEAALEKYTDLYDFAPLGYLTLDRDGAIREANLAGANLLGIERFALVNRRFGLFVSAADRPAFGAFLKKVFESKVREDCEVTLLLEGKRPLDVGMEALVFESRQACRVALMDITERKRAERYRLILNKLESTGILAGGIAHDFNNLLAVVVLHLEMAGRLPPGRELTRHLQEAMKTALIARGLTQQLVTFARGGAPVPKVTSLSGVIHESVRPALSGSRVRCEFSLAEDLWPAEVDEGQVGQVIRNMVLNAKEAMPQGGVASVRAENVVVGSQEKPSVPPGEYVRVSIADRGDGISKEVLPKIFDPYFSTKQRGDQKGMGLGLTICHAIIEKHNGTITVESEVGVGTTFHIYLPASRKLSGEEEASVPKALPRHGRILVMDDEEGVREPFGLTLQQMGHEVELAKDGETAIEVYERAKGVGRPFDVVILGLTVRGGMGGQEAIRALLRIDPTVKAIVTSGYANDPVVLEHERHGFKGALKKPFNTGELHEVVFRVMGS